MGLRESKTTPPARPLRLVKAPDPVEGDFIYPETDGKPMAENTTQYYWMTMIKLALEDLFKSENVFVAGDLLWYPLEKNKAISRAPDVMVVFGRPPGHRGSYAQCLEDNIPPQVVFEILSEANTKAEMVDKLAFYERYGVEEYYIWDPAEATFQAYTRSSPGAPLRSVAQPVNIVSPRMGVRMEVLGDELVLWGPDGERMLDYVRRGQRDRARVQAAEFQAQAERERAQAERERAQAAESRAQAERERAQAAEARVQVESERAQAERERAAAMERQLTLLQAKLRVLGQDTEAP